MLLIAKESCEDFYFVIYLVFQVVVVCEVTKVYVRNCDSPETSLDYCEDKPRTLDIPFGCYSNISPMNNFLH